MRTIHARTWYGGKKGRAAKRRLRALEKRIARGPLGQAMYGFASGVVDVEPFYRFMRSVFGGAS